METVYKCCLISKPRHLHARNTPPPPDSPPPPEDVGALFSLHAGGGGAPHMDEDGLRCYLSASQGEGEGIHDDDTKDVERLLEQIRGTGGGPRIPSQLFTGTLDDFHRILFSHDLNPPIRHHQRVHHDMTLPLSHYFIYSGHNPYYTRPPDQRRCSGGGGRSDEPIIRALKMGVRAIEVAMWPNSKEDDIKIHHGWKRNTPVSLTECLKSIKENAFVASPYPVIITLEDNLRSSDLQKKAGKVVLDVLGDVLYSPHADYVDVRGYAVSNNPLEDFPSPEELMGRVLLSTKPPISLLKKNKGKPVEVDVSKVHGTIEQDDDDQLHVSKGADDDDAAWGPEVPVFQNEKMQSDQKRDGGVLVPPRRRNDAYDDEDQKEQNMQPHEYPLYRHLFTIGPYKVLPSRRITNKTIERVSTLEIEPVLQTEPGKVRRLSWSKQQIEKAAEYCGTDIVRFTQRNILLIYPSVSIKRYPGATRVTSSNYNPFVGWVHGAQMVALNMQIEQEMAEMHILITLGRGYNSYVTHSEISDGIRSMEFVARDKSDKFSLQQPLMTHEYGRALWLMHGFYRANGGCGYVRKPDFLMQTEPEVFDPRKRQPVKKTLKVKVYMGDGWLMDFKHAQTSFIPDLWTSVGIAGVPADTTAMQNTKATENTWVPVWEDEFSFPLTVPEIALLRVEVHQYDVSDKDVFGGQTVLPVSELQPGIRAVALLDRQGNRFNNVKLLMRFEFV